MILLNRENMVFDLGKDIVFAKGGAEDGGLQECPEAEATHIWNREKNVAYMNDGEIRLVEVSEVPEEVKELEYKYVDGEFIINKDYVPYVSDKERIEALEDMVNMLLLGGNE
jgi:hypothetical protein